MYTITIDRSHCVKDGMCARVCPKAVIVQREKMTFPELVDVEGCIACGQCVAICLQSAIRHEAFPSAAIRAIPFEQMPDPEQVATLLETRRSIRSFRKKPVPKDVIERIIDGARYAPSAHNAQSTEYLVVQDRDMLKQISATVIEYLRFEIRRFTNPAFKTLALWSDRELAESGLHEIPGFRQMVRSFDSGDDPILQGAPALLVAHSRRTIGFADINAQLALQNASLVAHSLRIGHFYSGWVISPCRAPMAKAWNRRIPDLLGVPPVHTVHGALALGYPIPRFKRMIERKPARVAWV